MTKEARKEYLDILNDKKYAPDDIASKASKWVPEYLYRYRSFEGKHWKEEIEKGQVYLASADTFNDPLDCLVYIDSSKITKDSKCVKAISEQTSLSCDKVYQRIKENNNIVRTLDEYRKGVYCACFAETNTNILMWSHYSSKHEGFCIQYNTEDLGNTLKYRLFPVYYTDKKPDETEEFLNVSNNSVIRSFICKADVWSYEEEWRVLIGKDKIGDQCKYARRAISAIYLGCKCSKENREYVCQWGKDNNIAIYQMEIDPRMYRLESKKIR